METKASIIESYSSSNPGRSVDIILTNYPNFLGIVEAHTKGMVHVISSEKLYNRKKRQENLGIRVQVSSTSNPTADRAVENVMFEEEIENCNFNGDLFKDLDPKDYELFDK